MAKYLTAISSAGTKRQIYHLKESQVSGFARISKAKLLWKDPCDRNTSPGIFQTAESPSQGSHLQGSHLQDFQKYIYMYGGILT
jgi:hypothetical protein